MGLADGIKQSATLELQFVLFLEQAVEEFRKFIHLDERIAVKFQQVEKGSWVPRCK